MSIGFSCGSDDKEPAYNADNRPGFNLWVGKIPWSRAWQSTPVLVPGESHGQRNLVGYRPWSHIVSGMTEQLTHTCTC